MIGKTLAHRYRIDALIGSGGMAVVYRATDMRTKRVVAIKQLKEQYSQNTEFLERFDREAMASAKVRHPNIVSLLDIGEEEGQRYLVIEYVKGMTLKDLIRERGRLTPDEAIKITLYILSALEHAHERGIVHRDVKPQNVLVDDNGHIKIADFGIAKMADAATMTMADNSVMGSVHYFSPEQAKGKPATAASDLYSTGIVLYEMLTGRVPFDGNTPFEVARQHTDSKHKPASNYAPEVTPALEEILTKALCKDLSQRYQTAIQMSIDLRKARRQPQGGFVIMRPVAREDLEEAEKRPQHTKRVKRRRKPRKLTLVVSVILGLLILGFIGVMGYRIIDEALSYTTMPDAVGLEEAAGLRALERAGLRGTVQRYRDEMPMGQVYEQKPQAGERILRNEYVILYVSQGTGQLTVPDVLGLPQEKAVEALNAAGLEPGDILVDMSEMAPGLVFAQLPTAGEIVNGSTVVDLHISGGLVIVPDLSGISEEQAYTQLQNLGLAVGVVSRMAVEETERDGLVQSQYPIVGERVFPGTEIDLSVARAGTRPYRAEITVKVKIPQGGAHLRVVLVGEDDEEDQYAAMVTQEGDRSVKIEMRSSDVGEMPYRVYLDTLFQYEGVVTLR